MKKIMMAIAAILIACAGLWGLSHHLEKSFTGKNKQNLIIYNWGDYLDPKLIKSLKSRQVIMLSMRPLIPMKRCIPKSNKAERHMI